MRNFCEPDDPEADDPLAPSPEAEDDHQHGVNGLPNGLVNGIVPIKGRHGGCGHKQPQIRKEGLKLFCVYQKERDEEEVMAGLSHFALSFACIDGNCWRQVDKRAPKQQDRQLLSADACLQILRKISDPDLRLLGMSLTEARPEWMILTVLPVPPPAVRPSVAVDGGATRSEDDLTYKLVEVLRANQNLRRLQSEGAPAHILTEFETLLQVCSLSYSTITFQLTHFG